MLASPVFHRMFSGPFQEGETLRSNGSLQVELDDDPVAMDIVLGVLHNDPDCALFRIDLATLANVAVVFDKYQIYWDLVENFRRYAEDAWTSEISAGENLLDEGTFSDNNAIFVFEWLSIGWVFKIDEVFSRCTEILLLHFTPGSIQEYWKNTKETGYSFPFRKLFLVSLYDNYMDFQHS